MNWREEDSITLKMADLPSGNYEQPLIKSLKSEKATRHKKTIITDPGIRNDKGFQILFKLKCLGVEIRILSRAPCGLNFIIMKWKRMNISVIREREM